MPSQSPHPATTATVWVCHLYFTSLPHFPPDGARWPGAPDRPSALLPPCPPPPSPGALPALLTPFPQGSAVARQLSWVPHRHFWFSVSLLALGPSLVARPVLVFSISGGWRHPCTLGLQLVPPPLPYVVSTGPDPCRAAGSGCLLSSRLSPENLWRPQWSADKVDLPCTALFKVCQQPPVFLRLRTGCPLHQLRPLRSPDVCPLPPGCPSGTGLVSAAVSRGLSRL